MRKLCEKNAKLSGARRESNTIFFFNCEHFLLVYIVKKKFADFINKIWDFQNLMKIEFCWRLIFEILIIENLPFESLEQDQVFKSQYL